MEIILFISQSKEIEHMHNGNPIMYIPFKKIKHIFQTLILVDKMQKLS